VEVDLDQTWSSAVFPVPETGSYRIKLMLWRKHGSGAMGQEVGVPAELTVTVGDSSEVQMLVASVPSQSVENALKRF
jgi:hypothetical protein